MLFLTYLFHFLLAFQRHQFYCNPISEPKGMIKTYAKSKFEPNSILTLSGEISI
jgi:hypothetical protein